jgi:putative ABC transport system permease protein
MRLAIGDVRYGMRSLCRAPTLSTLTIVSLAVGTGALASTYALAHAAFVRPLPFPGSAQLVELDSSYAPGAPNAPKLALDVVDWQAMRQTFSGVSAISVGAANLASATGSRRVVAALVSPNLFDVLRVHPTVGRGFTNDEATPGNDNVAVLGAGLTRQLFSDQSPVGKTIDLDGQRFLIVGSMPKGFAFPNGADVWIPYPIPWDARRYDLFRQALRLTVIGRLRDGEPVGRAQIELRQAERQFALAHPSTIPLDHVHVLGLRRALVGDSAATVRLLSGAAVLVLLLACVNVAALSLARCKARQRDFAIRLAVGATPARMIRQQLVEAAILSVLGALGGALLSVVLRPVFNSVVPASLTAVGVRTPVWLLLLSLGAGTACAMISSLVPVIAITRVQANQALSSGSRTVTGGVRTWRALLTAQIGLTVVILISAGLLLKSLWGLEHVDLGFVRTGVLNADLALPSATYPTGSAVTAYYDRVLRELRATPGVADVGFVNILPMSKGSASFTFVPLDQPRVSAGENGQSAEVLTASTGYFSALRIATVAGQLYSDATAHANHAVVIDERVARTLGGAGRAVGQRLRLPWDSTVYTVWGVVRSIRDRSLDGSAVSTGQLYFPIDEMPSPFMSLVARGPVRDGAFVNEVRRVVQRVDPAVPAFDVRTLDESVDTSITPLRTVVLLFSLGAVFALILTVVGIYGVLAASVVRRQREIGIRSALGATRVRIGALILGEVLAMLVGGIFIGAAMAVTASHALSHLLYGIGSFDAFTWFVVLATVCGIAMVGASLPLWRAVSVDPLTCLQRE